MTGHGAPLAGLRVLEISAHAAWPLGGQTPAGLGAEVIRIDHADGGAEGQQAGRRSVVPGQHPGGRCPP
jgi:crotonobetainyl-CoA:carnitine CoA-transferase CaiB-like acyl-CoA transferase